MLWKKIYDTVKKDLCRNAGTKNIKDRESDNHKMTKAND